MTVRHVANNADDISQFQNGDVLVYDVVSFLDCVFVIAKDRVIALKKVST